MTRSLFLLLDIDNNLYDYDTTGFGTQMRELIYTYAQEKLHLTLEEAKELSRRYYNNYGLSLRGYVEEHHVDAKDYSDFVHRCSYEKLTYNAPLVEMLTRLHLGPDAATATTPVTPYGQHEKVLHHLYFFTNANRAHARRVLTPLGLRPLFTRAVQTASPVTAAHRDYDPEGFEEGVEWLGFSYEDQWRLTGAKRANKPEKAAYEAIFTAISDEIARDEAVLGQTAFPSDCEEAEANSGLRAPFSSPTQAFTEHMRAHLQPSNMVMVDDSLMNLDAPLELGWCVVWYAHGLQLPADNPLYTRAVAEGRMKIINNILELEKAVGELAAL